MSVWYGGTIFGPWSTVDDTADIIRQINDDSKLYCLDLYLGWRLETCRQMWT